VREGIRRVETQWVLFLADDDNLFPESLTRILTALGRFDAEVLVCNYNQRPYLRDNPLYQVDDFIPAELSPSDFLKLISWPKFAGIVLKNFTNDDLDVLNQIILESGYFAHVSLAIFRGMKFGRVVFCPTFIGEPDIDYLDHVNFPWYTGASMREELTLVFNILNISITKAELHSLTPGKYGVFDSSVTQLIYYYSRRTRVSVGVKKLLWKNITWFFLRREKSVEGIPYEVVQVRAIFKLFLLLIIAPVSVTLSKLLRKPLALMQDGF
jgi:hypothetical protein